MRLHRRQLLGLLAGCFAADDNPAHTSFNSNAATQPPPRSFVDLATVYRKAPNPERATTTANQLIADAAHGSVVWFGDAATSLVLTESLALDPGKIYLGHGCRILAENHHGPLFRLRTGIGSSDFVISGIHFDGSGRGGPGIHILPHHQPDADVRISIERCSFANFPADSWGSGFGIFSEAALSEIRVRNNHFENMAEAIHIEDSHNVDIANNKGYSISSNFIQLVYRSIPYRSGITRVVNNICENLGRMGCELWGGGGKGPECARIENNVFAHGSTLKHDPFLISVVEAGSTAISHNVLLGNNQSSTWGIEVSSDEAAVYNNVLSGLHFGIVVHEIGLCNIQGNRIQDYTRGGIYISNASVPIGGYLKIVKNVLRGRGGTGIEIFRPDLRFIIIKENCIYHRNAGAYIAIKVDGIMPDGFASISQNVLGFGSDRGILWLGGNRPKYWRTSNFTNNVVVNSRGEAVPAEIYPHYGEKVLEDAIIR